MLNKIIKIAEEAAEILMSYYDSDNEINHKENKDIVTTADIKVDEFLHKRIKEEFPNDQILSEETEDTVKNYSGNVWIIDPLDGTKQFTEKNQYFSINIGLCIGGIPTWGVVISPARNEIYYAEKNNGSFRRKNGVNEKLQVSDVNKLSDGRLVTNIPDGKQRKFDHVIEALNVKERLPISSWGVLFIASGEAEMFIQPSFNLRKWDTCGPQVIIEEAGGKITDIYGNSLNYKQQSTKWENSVVVSNSKVHPELIEEIQKLLN
jgi:3'(2'), 5'-bisphosphate nucleotidase